MSRQLLVYRPGHPRASAHGFVDTRDLDGWQDKPATLMVMGDSHYDGLQATDGTPIDTKRKHRQYMRENGLTTQDDYRQTWTKAEEKRKAVTQGRMPSKTRRDVIGRALYKLDKP